MVNNDGKEKERNKEKNPDKDKREKIKIGQLFLSFFYLLYGLKPSEKQRFF